MGSQLLEVGVLVATCDRHEMLTQRSLPSILRQTERPHHIVVVDDSRDDHVRLKNKDYIQSLEVEGVSIHYLSNARTKGACGAWNTGIFHLADICESLESTFLAILDDDDEWAPEYISQCMNATQNGRNDMVAADIARIKDMNHPPSQCPAPERLVASDFLIGNPGIQGSNLFIKLSVMLQAGCFDEAMRSSTDRDICIRICDLGDTKYQRVPSTLVKHYAEADRERMTTRGSTSKNKGLQYFFRKYMGRMTNDEIERFLERADRLFGWHPRKEEIEQRRLHRWSLNTVDYEKMTGFAEFLHNDSELVLETNPTLTHVTSSSSLTDYFIIFGVITNQPHTSANLLKSISTYFPGSKIVLLDNHSKQNELASLQNLVGELNLTCTIVDIPQQVEDAGEGKFGNVYLQRPEEHSVGISQARTMVQYYVGQMMLDTPHSIGWILDDDMVFDSRALSYGDYLMKLKHEDIDVVIGTYDGSSPNPPINALRTKLVDFVHNFSWLNALPPEAILPRRTEENQEFKDECSDYYYDLSRKHTNHLERPVWLEPQYDGETVKEAKTRLLLEMNGVLAGHPITRPVSPPPVDYQTDLNDSVNRGGNTIVLNPEALTRTPNLIFSVDGHEARRSDMLWAIINRFYRGLSIKAANIPILHQPRYASTNKMDERKVIAEIMGSCLYAGLTDHLSQSVGQSFGFDDDEVNLVSEKSLHRLHHRKRAFRWNLIRVKGLMKTVSSFYHEEEMPDFVRSINLLQLDKLMTSIEHFAGSSFKCTVNEFLLNIIGNVESYANSKTGENFR